MERISDRKTLQRMLSQAGIEQYFDTPELRFEGFRYRKGEYLARPEDSDQYLQIIIAGTLRVDSLREDGSLYSLAFSDLLQPGVPFLLGDMQFAPATGEPPAFYAQALTDTTCVALPLPIYRERLREDVKFLNLLVAELSCKLRMLSGAAVLSASLEERLLNHLRLSCPDGTLRGLEHTAQRLHCSSRQLQRVLNCLEAQGIVIRCGKGTYQLL